MSSKIKTKNKARKSNKKRINKIVKRSKENNHSKSVINEKQNATKELIELYGQICFLGGKIELFNKITYHHIDPKLKRTVENGALLCRLEHYIFHELQRFDPKKAAELNDVFREYKITRSIKLIEESNLYIYNWVEANEYEIRKNEYEFILQRKK